MLQCNEVIFRHRRVSVSQCSFIVAPHGGGKRPSLSSFSYTFKNTDSFQICKAVEIILTLSGTFKGSADQQSVDVKTDLAFLGHDDLFSQIYMTPPEGQMQVISLIRSV